MLIGLVSKNFETIVHLNSILLIDSVTLPIIFYRKFFLSIVISIHMFFGCNYKMKKFIIVLITSLFTLLPSVSHAEFTVAMYNKLKTMSSSSNAEVAKRANEMISTYLMGVASGVNGISHFESEMKGTSFPYCLPKGTKLTPTFAEYIVDSVLSDKDIKLDNVDDIGLSSIYVIGILRYYKCPK